MTTSLSSTPTLPDDLSNITIPGYIPPEERETKDSDSNFPRNSSRTGSGNNRPSSVNETSSINDEMASSANSQFLKSLQDNSSNDYLINSRNRRDRERREKRREAALGIGVEGKIPWSEI